MRFGCEELTVGTYDRLLLDAVVRHLELAESQKPLKQQSREALHAADLDSKLARAHDAHNALRAQLSVAFERLHRYMPTREAQRMLRVLRQTARLEWSTPVTVQNRCCLTCAVADACVTLFGEHQMPEQFHVAQGCKTFLEACMLVLNAPQWMREQAAAWLASSGKQRLALDDARALHAWAIERPAWVAWNHALRWLWVQVAVRGTVS